VIVLTAAPSACIPGPRGARHGPRARTACRLALAAVWLGTSLAAGAAGAPEPFYRVTFERTPSAADLGALGRRLFFDVGLSSSGRIACATCHAPDRAYGPANNEAVQRGGADQRAAGLRAAPSLRYTQNIPPFTEHYFESDGNDSEDQGPAGGRTWDGRAQSAHDQAPLPLLSPLEMANPSPEAIVAKVARAPYARDFRRAFGPHLFDESDRAFKAVLIALEVFQQSPKDFYPYSSRYDAWLRGQAALTAAQARGLALFNDPAKGNCARCHPSAIKEGAFPAFSDYGYVALGVPRNPAIPANADPQYYDLGLCGPLRADLSDHGAYCGMFRTPSLRNVAARGAFFHNGAVHRLRDAVRFYAERDARPAAWYPRDNAGRVDRFDDLPPAYRANVEANAPFGQHDGDPPPLDDAQIDDLVEFLKALTDRDVVIRRH
jgi:cytochrome c peroxidase